VKNSAHDETPLAPVADVEAAMASALDEFSRLLAGS